MNPGHETPRTPAQRPALGSIAPEGRQHQATGFLATPTAFVPPVPAFYCNPYQYQMPPMIVPPQVQPPHPQLHIQQPLPPAIFPIFPNGQNPLPNMLPPIDTFSNVYQCPYQDCKYRGTFQSVDYLRRHIKEQHLVKPDDQHLCQGQNWGCGKSFKRPYQLVNHWKSQRSLLNCRVPSEILEKHQITACSSDSPSIKQ